MTHPVPRKRVDGQVGEERLDAVVEEAEDKEGVDALGDDQQEGPDGRPRTAHKYKDVHGGKKERGAQQRTSSRPDRGQHEEARACSWYIFHRPQEWWGSPTREFLRR